jgi:hypothetical protein
MSKNNLMVGSSGSVAKDERNYTGSGIETFRGENMLAQRLTIRDKIHELLGGDVRKA